MSINEEEVQSLLDRSSERERKARRAALGLTLIPVLFALVFLGFTLGNIYLAQQELGKTQAELAVAGAELARSTATLAVVNDQLASSSQDIEEVKAQLATKEVELAVKNEQLAQAEIEINTNQIALATVQTDLVIKQEEYNSLESQVRLASQFSSVRSYEQWTVGLKGNINNFYRIYGQVQGAAEMGERLVITLDNLYAQSPPFNGRGTTLEEGFTSPSFALYVLNQIGRVPESDVPILQQGELREYLLKQGMKVRPNTRPRLGDLILYDEGFTMFYLQDENGSPFVMGMTAAGVKILSPDFAKIIEVISVLP